MIEEVVRKAGGRLSFLQLIYQNLITGVSKRKIRAFVPVCPRLLV